jgi:hypothetical protein
MNDREAVKVMIDSFDAAIADARADLTRMVADEGRSEDRLAGAHPASG